MTCDKEFAELKEKVGGLHGIHEVLFAYAEDLYNTLNNSPGAFVQIAGKYQKLAVLLDDAQHKLLVLPRELEDYKKFLKCVAKHIRK